MIPYFQALFIQRHGMISALMIYGPKEPSHGFESIKPTFRILSLYTKTGVSLITAGYRRLPQDTAGSPDMAFSMEFTILLHGIGII